MMSVIFGVDHCRFEGGKLKAASSGPTLTQAEVEASMKTVSYY